MSKNTAASLGSISEICGSRPSSMLGWNKESPKYVLMCGEKELDIVEFCANIIVNSLRKIVGWKYKNMERLWVYNDVVESDGDRLVFDMQVVGEMSKQRDSDMKRGR